MGPSGSGKSTLFHILGGLSSASSGHVMVDGRDLSETSDAERTRMRKTTVGFVFQKHNLLPTLTAADNIAIARAIVNHPAILLADEPSGNLDSENSAAVLRVLRDLNERLGQTVLMITHDPTVASYGHRIVHMLDGRIVEDSA
jgi:putative ABC transport system ATP-binding protein